MKAKAKINLPGDMSKREKLARLIRVNHAGEYGAKRIYQGQIDVLGDNPESRKQLEHMQEQEQEHLDIFTKMMQEHKIRPSILQPFWYVAGYGLGALPALAGKQAAMAVTIAIEETIEEHYNQQLEELDDIQDAELKATITRIRNEEIEHRDIGLENGGQDAVAYPVLYGAVRLGCKAAIAVAKRF